MHIYRTLHGRDQREKCALNAIKHTFQLYLCFNCSIKNFRCEVQSKISVFYWSYRSLFYIEYTVMEQQSVL